MIRRIFLHRSSLERVAILKRENRFVLGTVILVDAANVLPERNTPHKQKKHSDANQAVDKIKEELVAEHGIHALKLSGREQREILVHEDEEQDGKRHVKASHPARNFEFLALIFVRTTFQIAIRIFAARLAGRDFFEHGVRGKLQRAESEAHGVAERHYAAHYRPAHPLVLL